ncbi:MAG: radical SAM protein [Candidatus Bathyarchaeia archaeon]
MASQLSTAVNGLMLRKVLNSVKILRSSVSPHPLHVQWFLTGRCNYRCSSCLVWTKSPNPELSTNEVKKGLDALMRLRVASLTFTGGNPLLRNDIEEILRYSHERFPLVAIYDNGSLAHKKLAALRYADRVCISLNTDNPPLQDRMSGVKQAYHNAVKSIETLTDANIPVSVSITVSEANMNDALKLIRRFSLKGISVNLSLYSEDNASEGIFQIGTHVNDLTIRSKDRMLRFLVTLRKLKMEHPIHLSNRTLTSLETFFANDRRDWTCQGLSSFFVVNELGDVSACHLYPSVCKVWDLPQLWESSEFQELRTQCNRCEKCSYLCYIEFSHDRRISDLLRYAWEYESHRLNKIIRSE